MLPRHPQPLRRAAATLPTGPIRSPTRHLSHTPAPHFNPENRQPQNFPALHTSAFFSPTKRPSLSSLSSPYIAIKPASHGNLPLGVRLFSFSSIPKILAKSARIPTAVGSVIVGGASYVSYKVNEAANYTQDKLDQVRGWLADSVDAASGFWDSLDFGSGGSEGGNSGNSGDSRNPGDPGGGDGAEKAAAAATASAAASAVAVGDEEPEKPEEEPTMLHLTKQMIEIRTILSQIDEADTLQLPAIVVIGSQSSGKSSVLEAVVGHEFLPKGSNMVTRRPIELTLVNTPNSAAEYGEFPSLKMGKITDFSQIQKILVDLNLAVPANECISDDPIQLNIYSPLVPDLTLIDLPGYIQVESADQPPELQRKINDLCAKYIQPPNVILAISAADVDLANSSSLRASRAVDPRGERTIGVITKMDLVDPARSHEILQNNSYPLSMGYVGVVTKVPSGGLFRRSNSLSALVAQNEDQFFSRNHEFYGDCEVGTRALKKKLMKVLEKSMAKSLQPTAELIRQELEETSYLFKVEFNDRSLTAESYLAGSVDAFKLAFKNLSQSFGRNEVRSLLRAELDQKVLDLLAQRYWNKPVKLEIPAVPGKPAISEIRAIEPPLSELPQAAPDDVYWHRKLDAATSNLTKMGIGRMATTLVINSLLSEMDRLVMSTSFKNHHFAHEMIKDATVSVLNSRFYSTADQVENCIKPYKYEIEVEDREWNQSREHAIKLLKEELRQCEDAYHALKKSIGGRKLNQVVAYVDSLRKAELNGTRQLSEAPENSEAFGFSANLLNRGKEAVFLRDRADILRMRTMALKSKQCKVKENKYFCPEIFLDVVADKLTHTAVLFLNVELLSDFYYNFPRELDDRLSRLTKEQIEAFAKEDPKVRRHIELQQRKELLELAMEKIEDVITLQKSKIHREPNW